MSFTCCAIDHRLLILINFGYEIVVTYSALTIKKKIPNGYFIGGLKGIYLKLANNSFPIQLRGNTCLLTPQISSLFWGD